MSAEPSWWSRARERASRGVPMTVIARVEKRDYSTVRYVVKEHYREEKNAARRQRREELRAEAQRLREQGMTYAEISAETGYSESYCYLLCNPDAYRQHRIKNGKDHKRRYHSDQEYRERKLRQNHEWRERNL